MLTVLVTASGGNAGRHCVEVLLSQGFSVVATARDPAKLRFPPDVQTRRFDIGSQTDFVALFEGIDVAVLIGPPLDGLVHEKLGPFIAAAKEARIGHLVYLSGNYLSGMTGATLARQPVRKVELQIMNSGLKYTLVRSGFFMDNYVTGFYAKMVAQGQITLATGEGKSALIAATDVAQFVAAAIRRSLTGEYIVTGPRALDHVEVAALLSRKNGKRVSYVPVSEADLVSLYEARKLDPESVDYGSTLYRSYANHATAAVTDGFRQATGNDPISFERFLGLTE